jgi:hypothetical protein
MVPAMCGMESREEWSPPRAMVAIAATSAGTGFQRREKNEERRNIRFFSLGCFSPLYL